MVADSMPICRLGIARIALDTFVWKFGTVLTCWQLQARLWRRATVAPKHLHHDNDRIIITPEREVRPCALVVTRFYWLWRPSKASSESVDILQVFGQTLQVSDNTESMNV
jgi:hypothetical protein